MFHENHRSAQANVRLLLSPRRFPRQGRAWPESHRFHVSNRFDHHASPLWPKTAVNFVEQLAQVRAYGRRPIYIPLCFWSLESNWLDSGLIVLHGVPFVQRIRTTSACE